MLPLRVFVGADPRQPIAYSVCRSSIERRASKRVQVEPIGLYDWIPGFTRRGLTSFSLARYMAPAMCNYQGISIFMDGDIVVRGDVHELASCLKEYEVAAVAQHVARFEWPSVIVFNNWRSRALSFEYVNNPNTAPHALEWANPMGLIPPEWNHIVGYEPHNEAAKLIHFTAGIPCWPETKNCPHSDKWWDEFQYQNSTVSWEELMGNSVHRDLVKSGIWTA